MITLSLSLHLSCLHVLLLCHSEGWLTYVLQLVLPEYALHMFFTILFIFAFQLGSLLWNLPLAVYHIRRYALNVFIYIYIYIYIHICIYIYIHSIYKMLKMFFSISIVHQVLLCRTFLCYM